MKKYVKPNLYLYLGKNKQTWYHKEGNKSKAIGEYPHMSEEQALAIKDFILYLNIHLSMLYYIAI